MLSSEGLSADDTFIAQMLENRQRIKDLKSRFTHFGSFAFLGFTSIIVGRT